MIWLAFTLTILLFLLGIVFTIYPVLPGAVFAFVGVLVYGWIAGFHTLPKWVYVVSAIMVLLNFATDTIASILGVKKAGGSKYAVIGATIGTFVLPFLLGPIFGIIVGPVAGAIVGEMIYVRRTNHLVKVGIASLLGFLMGTLLKLITVLVIIISFFVGRS